MGVDRFRKVTRVFSGISLSDPEGEAVGIRKRNSREDTGHFSEAIYPHVLGFFLGAIYHLHFLRKVLFHTVLTKCCGRFFFLAVTFDCIELQK